MVSNVRSITPIWGFNSRKLPKRFLCVHQVKKVMETFLIDNQL